MIGNIWKILGFLRCHRMGLLECATGLTTNFSCKNGRSTDPQETIENPKYRLLSLKTGFYHKAIFSAFCIPR